MLEKSTFLALAKSLVADGVYPALIDYARISAPTAAIEADGVRTISADHGEIVGLTLNENKANLSILVKTPMKVKVPANALGLGVIDTFRFNNYALVADGRINTRTIPVSATEESFAALKEMGGLSGTWEPGKIYELDFAALNLPLAAFPTEFAAADLCRLHRRLRVAKAANKFRADRTPAPAPDNGYTPEQLAFLKGIGISPEDGYSPKRERIGNAPRVFAWVVEIAPAGLKQFDAACKVDGFRLAESGAAIENPKEILEQIWLVKAGMIAGVTKLTGLDPDDKVAVDGQTYTVTRRQKA